MGSVAKKIENNRLKRELATASRATFRHAADLRTKELAMKERAYDAVKAGNMPVAEDRFAAAADYERRWKALAGAEPRSFVWNRPVDRAIDEIMAKIGGAS